MVHDMTDSVNLKDSIQQQKEEKARINHASSELRT